MPLTLSLAVPSAHMTAHEGLMVEVRIENGDARPWEIPSLYDQTGTLGFEVRTPAQALVHRFDGLTRQAANSPGRLDHTLLLETIAPGAIWKRQFDLANYGPPLPPGEFEVRAVFKYPAGDLVLRSEPVTVVVSDRPLRSVSVYHDNPVLDRLALLLEADGEPGPAYYLRVHAASRPLAAWYSTRLDLGDEVRDPFLSTNDCFKTESFDPFFARWVLWGRAGNVHARSFQSGRATGESRAALVPAGRRIIRSSFEVGGRLHVLFEAPGGMVECHVLGASTLEKAFERPLPSGSAVAVAADAGAIHLVHAHRGLVYERLTHRGEHVESRRIAATGMRPHHCAFDSNQAIRAIFADTPHGRSILLVHANLRTGEVAERAFDLAGHRGEVREMSFARDADGRFHFLFSTADQRLLYYLDRQGPARIAGGEDRFFPCVVAGTDAFLGFYRRQDGYRFIDRWPRGI
jgi:hypothetical protein